MAQRDLTSFFKPRISVSAGVQATSTNAETLEADDDGFSDHLDYTSRSPETGEDVDELLSSSSDRNSELIIFDEICSNTGQEERAKEKKQRKKRSASNANVDDCESPVKKKARNRSIEKACKLIRFLSKNKLYIGKLHKYHVLQEI